MLGNGNGSFREATDFAAGNGPRSIVKEDFNSDGTQDLAAADGNSNSVAILLGIGDGSFSAPASFYGPGESIALGDFNRDGRWDLVVLNSSTLFWSYLGNGDGTFTLAASYPTAALSVAIGDLNGDGRQDLAVAGSVFFPQGSISVLNGNGDGTFQQPAEYSVGSIPRSVAAGDFNGDGNQDLAVVSEDENSVSILQNDGVGTFLAGPIYIVGPQPWFVAVGNLTTIKNRTWRLQTPGPGQ